MTLSFSAGDEPEDDAIPVTDLSTSLSTRAPRRTQAARRAATRGALLDATLAALNEVGYARLTTSDVALRAGVTRGAQAHYFATKAELVIEALRHLTDKLLEELVSKPLRPAPGHRAQYEALLNRLWEIYAGEPAIALLELFVAARTDEELREQLLRFERGVARRLAAGAAVVAPDLAASPEFASQAVTALATIRGLWLLRATVSERTVRRIWVASKAQLVAGVEQD